MIESLLAAVALAAAGAPEEPRVPRGESVQGRKLKVWRVGDAASPRRILVVGCIHGNECAGIPVARRLARTRAAARIDLWIVPNLNPDGLRLGVRQNARGVDLNRNFPAGWRPNGGRWSATYPGPRPLSEPEVRFGRRLIARLRPDVTIWYHQPQTLVRTGGRKNTLARRYARLVGLPFRKLPVPRGAATRWQLRAFPRTQAFVVELAPGPLSPAGVRRHARAVRRLVAP